MKNLFKAIIVFLCILNLISSYTFAGGIQDKEPKVLKSEKDIKQDYFNSITESVNDTIKIYNQLLIEKTLTDYNIVDEKSSYNKKIRKGDFVKAVLKIMGVTDEFAEYVDKCVTIEYNSSKTAFSNKVRKEGREELYKYEDEKGLYPYILLINAYKIVTKGDFKDTENSYIDDDIELEECLHIMNKCLNEEALAEDVISLAEKNGLIKNTDEMMTKSEKTINYEDFCTLLYRMLNHHMGYYFKFYDYDWAYSFYRKEKTDEKGYRYRDYLDYVKNQDLEGFYVPDIYK